jgi:hypothetical protein
MQKTISSIYRTSVEVWRSGKFAVYANSADSSCRLDGTIRRPSGLTRLENVRSWVGLSHDTGQLTHHIEPNIDAERDLLMRDLRQARMVERLLPDFLA